MNVLLVVANSASLTLGDLAIQSRLATTLGHTVTLINDETAEATGYPLVVISESCASATLASKYATSTSPVLILDGAAIDNFGMATIGTSNFSNSVFDVVPGADPDALTLAAGYGVNTTITASTSASRQQSVAVANLAAGCTVISLRDGAPTATPHFYIGAGDALTPSGTAPNRRVFIGYRDNIYNDGAGGLLTTAGWDLFDAAVEWLAQRVDGGQATETDTANAGQVPNLFPGNLATETDTANAGGYVRVVVAEVELGGTVTAPVASISLEMVVSKTLLADEGEIRLSLRQTGDVRAASAWTALTTTPTLLQVAVDHGDLNGWDDLTAYWEIRTSSDVTAQISDLTLEIVSAAAQVTETDAANPGSAQASTGGNLATETDSAFTGTTAVTVGGNHATETDTANPGTPTVIVAGNLATETDTAFVGEAISSADEDGAQALEDDSALPGVPTVTVAGQQATEADSALPGGLGITGALVAEVDSAFAGLVLVVVDGQLALEADTALSGTESGGQDRNLTWTPRDPRGKWAAGECSRRWAAGAPEVHELLLVR